MLYATTRSNVATYTAQRALKEERATDGGFYLPTALPVLGPEELEELLQQPAGEITARILNLFFNGKLGRLDVEFAVGRQFFGLPAISHRIAIGELWRNREGGFDALCRRLADRISAEVGVTEPGMWLRISCRIALIFGMVAQLRRADAIAPGELIDAAVLTGNFEGPFALYAARKMGLPIGQIICCCNDNGGFWERLNRGQMKLDAKVLSTGTPKCDAAVPEGLELLIRDRLEWEDMLEYQSILDAGGTWYLGAEAHRQFREGFAAAVVSDKRIRLAMPNLYSTNGYILCPYSALVYTGLMDYRTHPGPRRATLMLTEFDPRDCAATVTKALTISDAELKDWCLNG